MSCYKEHFAVTARTAENESKIQNLYLASHQEAINQSMGCLTKDTVVFLLER